MAASPYTAVSLYSGAGGLDWGFERAGFEVAWAIESDRHAVATYQANLGQSIVHGSLPEVQPPDDLHPDIVIGGPPCQGFSVIGRMDPDDPRSRHVHHFLDQVARLEPRAFCMENVKALGEAERWAGVRDDLVSRGKDLGYEVELMILNAADYGVPQARERMFLIGVRDGVPQCPVPSTKGEPPSVRDALATLPPFGCPGNGTTTSARIVPASRPVMRPDPYRGSLLFNGSGRPLQLDEAAKTLPASMGGNATPIIDQEELAEGSEAWVVGYHKRLRQGRAPNIRAPRRLRRITVEEVAALQSFPSSWSWVGPRGSRYRQVGNAVPPMLARSVAISLRESLEGIDQRRHLQAVAPRLQQAHGTAGRDRS